MGLSVAVSVCVHPHNSFHTTLLQILSRFDKTWPILMLTKVCAHKIYFFFVSQSMYEIIICAFCDILSKTCETSVLQE